METERLIEQMNESGGADIGRLVCTRGENLVDETIELRQTITLGRSNTCDVVLKDEGQSVSRQHCRVEVEGETVSVVDLGSTNGVFVNGRRIQESELAPGDTLKIGHQFEFRLERGDVSQIEASPEPKAIAEEAAKKDELPGGILVRFVLPVVLMVIAVVGLVSAFQKEEKAPPKAIPQSFHNWPVKVTTGTDERSVESEEVGIGVALEIPFEPSQDVLLYQGQRLTGATEVFLIRYAEIAGEVPIIENPNAKEADSKIIKEKVGFFVEVSETRNESWSPREVVEFEGTSRWVGTRSAKRTEIVYQATKEFEDVWVDPSGSRRGQAFQIVESRLRRGRKPVLNLTEFYAELPYRRLVVGAVCRSGQADILFGVLSKALKSVKLDSRILNQPTPTRDSERAATWFAEAESRMKAIDRAPENLYRAIEAYRQAIWYSPSDSSNVPFNFEEASRKLQAGCELLDSKYEEAEARISANDQIGRRNTVLQEVRSLIQQIPDYRDERIYPYAGRYHAVRYDFPSLRWYPRLLDRIEYQ